MAIMQTPAIMHTSDSKHPIEEIPPSPADIDDNTEVDIRKRHIREMPTTMRIRATNMILLISLIPELLAASLQISCILFIALASGME